MREFGDHFSSMAIMAREPAGSVFRVFRQTTFFPEPTRNARGCIPGFFGCDLIPHLDRHRGKSTCSRQNVLVRHRSMNARIRNIAPRVQCRGIGVYGTGSWSPQRSDSDRRCRCSDLMSCGLQSTSSIKAARACSRTTGGRKPDMRIM